MAPPEAARELVKSECARVQTARVDEGVLASLDRLLAEEWWTAYRWAEVEAR